MCRQSHANIGLAILSSNLFSCSKAVARLTVAFPSSQNSARFPELASVSWNFQERLDFGVNTEIIDTFSFTMCQKSHANIGLSILSRNLSEFPRKSLTVAHYCMFSSKFTSSFVRIRVIFINPIRVQAFLLF